MWELITVMQPRVFTGFYFFSEYNTVEFKSDYVLGFIICEMLTEITLQDWVGWNIYRNFGYPRRANGDSQHLEACPELRDWLRFELYLQRKMTGQGPFQND